MADDKIPIIVESLDFPKLIVSILVLIVTLVIFVIYKRRKSAANGILLTGLCDSGKTLLYSQLLYKKHIQTHTSIKENIDEYPVNNKILKIIDVPGHERLRDKFFEQYKSVAKGIVFVIDSLTIQQDIRDAAEYFYNILTDPIVASNRPKILVLCNKQDQSVAKGSNIIKTIFEKELNTLRLTKSSQLESVDPKIKQGGILGGTTDGDFSFSLLPLKVEFAECFAFNKNGAVDIEKLTNWLPTV